MPTKAVLEKRLSDTQTKAMLLADELTKAKETIVHLKMQRQVDCNRAKEFKGYKAGVRDMAQMILENIP